MGQKSAFNWILEKFKNNNQVASANVSDGLLIIDRVEGESLEVAALTNSKIYEHHVKTTIEQYTPDFILHTDKNAYIHGDAIAYAEGRRTILGSYSDLFGVIRQEMNWPFESKQSGFILRILRQHDHVAGVRRLDNKRYEVIRHGLEPVTLLYLDEYDLTVNAVRSAVDTYEEFDAIVPVNPYGRISSDAVELADSRTIKVLKIADLMRELNRKWT